MREREFLCGPYLKEKDIRLFFEPTLYGQDLQTSYCLEDSRISSIAVSMYFTKSIKYIFFISLFMVLLPLRIKS